ncbi:MAG: helix-turn-helix domain-containing protein [Propionicimonas sp.]|nr:helix-turn-helix domain-containing protein [Propionicimonas sp.]
MKQRRDAQRNRIRILAAATEVFREQGVEAPLELVASRAEVGRGTLYRHFPNRAALVAALMERRLTALEEFAAAHTGEDLLEHLMVEISELQIRIPGLRSVVRGGRETPELFHAVLGRTRALFAGALDVALREGAVRPDVTVDDVYLSIAMIDGAVAAARTSVGPSNHERAIALVLRSLRRERRLTLPSPQPQVDKSMEAAASFWTVPPR